MTFVNNQVVSRVSITTTRVARTMATMVLGIAICGMQPWELSAAPIQWIGGGASDDWSDLDNWTDVQTPDPGSPKFIPGAGPSAAAPTTTSTVVFGEGDSGSGNTMNLGDTVITSFISSNAGSAFSHTMALGTSKLTMDSMSLADHRTDGTGTRYFGDIIVSGSAGAELNVTDNLTLAPGRGGDADLVMGTDVVLNIGTSTSDRGVLRVAYNNQGSYSENIASLTPGTTMNAYLTELSVGRKISTLGESRTNIGTLDLSPVTTGVLDISGDVFVGEGFGIRGALTVPDTLDMKIGVDAGTRGTLHVAAGRAKEGPTAISTMTLGTGTLDAYLTELNVGTVTQVARVFGATNDQANGTLDLSSVSGGILDVDGTISIAVITADQQDHASGTDLVSVSALGTVMLPSTITASTTDLIIGTDRLLVDPQATSPDAPAIGTGLLELDGTLLTVSGDVTLDGGSGTDEQSIVRTIINGESAGLSLSSTSLLTVDNAEIELIFQGPVPSLGSEPYYGLRWDGDHVAALEGLALSGKLIIDDSGIDQTAGIFLFEGNTYVGLNVVPEPSSLLLLGLGMLGMARYARRRKV